MGAFKCVSVVYNGLEEEWLEKAEVVECTPNGDKKAARVLLSSDKDVVIIYYEDKYMNDKLLEAELKRIKACMIIEYKKLMLKRIMGGNFHE